MARRAEQPNSTGQSAFGPKTAGARRGNAPGPGRADAAGGRVASRAARDTSHADAKLRGDPANPDFRVADWPFYLIARTARRYEMDMEAALRRIDMDVPSWRAMMLVLRLLARGLS